MNQSIALITLSVSDLEKSVRFYSALGWEPGFHNEEVAFFQMNGFVFGLYARANFEAELGARCDSLVQNFSLAHNVSSEAEVDRLMEQARMAGATIRKEPIRRDWGGYSGYFTDPDGHAWEVAVNPAWSISAAGHVTMNVTSDSN